MIKILCAFIVFMMILGISEILKSRPKWLVRLYCDIWERPYPSNKRINKIGQYIAIAMYILILIYVIYLDK